MSLYTGIDFFQLAARHSEAVANVKVLRQRILQKGHDDAQDSFANAVARENDMRAALLEWKPRSKSEAQLKLLYLAQYMFATRGSLSDAEMAVVMDSIAHLKRK
jgi:hypothetical protein